MHGGVDEHRRRFHRVPPGQPPAVAVDHDDVVGLHLAPQQAARIEQEALRPVGQFDAEVVAHAFGEAVPRGRPQGEREAGPQAGDVGRVEIEHGRHDTPAAGWTGGPTSGDAARPGKRPLRPQPERADAQGVVQAKLAASSMLPLPL